MSASLRATQQALDDLIDPARIQKRWNKHDERWAEAADVSLKTLQRFWSQEPIRRANFIAICQAIDIEDWKAIADLNQPPVMSSAAAISISPAVYNQATWVERSAVTESLLSILKSPCRILAITGITGIGKTALAERLVAELEDGKQFCRLNLNNGGLTPDLLSSGATLLRALGEEPTLEDQKDPKNLLAHLVQLLSKQPYRIQIDSLEQLLVGNDQEGWSEFQDSFWQDLLQQVLAGNQCQSQLILTTQDIPGELDTIGSCYPQLWHHEALQGLSEVEQLVLFQKFGLPLAPDSDSYLKRIGKLYEGHPLVLRVIAADINACGGDVTRYWQQCRFADLEAKHPVRFSRQKLQREVKQRVKISLQRLPDDAYQLLCRSAVYRRPVPEAFWLAMLSERLEFQQQAALNLLLSRGFATEDWKPDQWLGIDGSVPLRQHNLIRTVAYELLKTYESTWETAQHQAAELWLTAYEPASEVPNLEKLRGYLEAFHHYCEVENWEKASKILLTRFETPAKEQFELHTQLQSWGYYQEQIQLCIRLIGKNSPQISVICSRAVGNSYYYLSDYKRAISYYQKSLTAAQETGDRRGERMAFGNIGNCYHSLGDYRKAIEYHQRNLDIAIEIVDRRGEGTALGNLGFAYHYLGDYHKAIEYHQQSLNLAYETKDAHGQKRAIANLGFAYHYLNDYPKAIKYHTQYLDFADRLGDRFGRANGLCNLGRSLIKILHYTEALNALETSLTIAREVGSRTLEVEALRYLSEIYKGLKQHNLAQQYCEQALALATELEIPLAEECRKLQEELEKGGG